MLPLPEDHARFLDSRGFERVASRVYRRRGSAELIGLHPDSRGCVWYAPRTSTWHPGIKFDTPEAAISFGDTAGWSDGPDPRG